MKPSVLSSALITSALTTCTLLPLALHAEESQEWQVSSSMYLWAAGVGGNVTNGGEIDVPFSDIIQTLDMSLMGNIEARKDKWFVATDLFYIALSDEANGLINPDAGDVALKGSYELTETIITPTVGYNLIDTAKGTLDAFVGAQYVHLDTTIELSSTGTLGNHYKKFLKQETWWMA